MNAEIIKPYGFCLGVKRTIDLTKKLRYENPNKEIILLGYPIHNEDVINDLLDNKIKIIDSDYDDLIKYIDCFNNKDAIYVLSAHGHADDIIKCLNKYELTYLDTTCPYIKTIHKKLESINENDNVLYIGDQKHVECITSIRHIKSSKIKIKKEFTLNDLISDDENKTVLINQSTYYIENKLDELSDYIKKIDNLEIIDNFCPCVMQRMSQIKNRINEFGTIIVVGSKTSSNAKAIEKYCNSLHKETIFISNSPEIFNKLEYLDYHNKTRKIGIITATSAPSYLAEAIYDTIEDYNYNDKDYD